MLLTREVKAPCPLPSPRDSLHPQGFQSTCPSPLTHPCDGPSSPFGFREDRCHPTSSNSLNPCGCWWGGMGGTLGGAQHKPHKTSWQTSSGPPCTAGGRRQACRASVQVLSPGPPQVICLTVLASVRIYYQYRRVKPVTREIVIRDPYALRPLRRLIDAYAFRIYGHWVKKGQQQNRAALFENTPKAVLLSLAEEDY